MSAAATVRTDPPRRTDGYCARPGCMRRLPAGPPKTMPKSLRPMFVEALAADPFCSSVCARLYHGNPEPAESIWKLHHGAGA